MIMTCLLELQISEVDAIRREEKQRVREHSKLAMAAPLFSPRPPKTPFSVAGATFSSIPSLFSSTPNHFSYHCQVAKRSRLVTSSYPEPVSGNSFGKRDLVLFGLSSSASLLLPSCASASTELDREIKMETVVDDINAYSFIYPTESPSKNTTLKWIISRKPERYSSAPPLSPNARQRIVSERVDLINNLIISVSIGPPNSSFLTSSDKTTWTAKNVADSVLSDKAALRVTTTQRKAESSVLDTHSGDVDGETYWYCEYLVRKSPTKSVPESNLFRHYVASIFERDGYLYTLNASTLSKQWPSMGSVLQKTASSFRQIPPTENYVPPFKDPWRFW